MRVIEQRGKVLHIIESSTLMLAMRLDECDGLLFLNREFA